MKLERTASPFCDLLSIESTVETPGHYQTMTSTHKRLANEGIGPTRTFWRQVAGMEIRSVERTRMRQTLCYTGAAFAGRFRCAGGWWSCVLGGNQIDYRETCVPRRKAHDSRLKFPRNPVAGRHMVDGTHDDNLNTWAAYRW